METNATLGCSAEFRFDFHVIYITIPLNVLIVGKSLLVFFTVCKAKSLHTNTKILMTSLSVVELIMGAAYICSGDIGSKIFERETAEILAIQCFILGEWHSSIVGTVIHMAIMAVDRYILITHPFYYIKHVTKRAVFISLFFAWIFGLGYLFLPLLAFRDIQYHKRCIIVHPPFQYFCIGIFAYTLSSIVVLVSYFKIARLAYLKRKAANARKIQRTASNDGAVLKNKSTIAFRSVKFFALMYGVFLMCTLPPALATGLNTFMKLPKYVYLLTMFLMPLNSLLSFVIYFYMCNKFSKAVKRACSDFKMSFCKRDW